MRRFRVPDARARSVCAGTARLEPDAPDDVLDSLLGIRNAKTGGITVTSSQHLPARHRRARLVGVRRRSRDRVEHRHRVARRGSGSTSSTPQPVTFDHLDLQVVADGKHSVPTQLQIDAGGESRTVDVPAITDGKVGDAPVAVPVSFARAHRRPTCGSR